MNQIKKYIGNSMTEILDRIREDLGQEAVIIKSSSKQKVFSGLRQFEVVAGIEAASVKRNQGIQPQIAASKAVESVIKQFNSKTSASESGSDELKVKQKCVIGEIQELKTLLVNYLPEPIVHESEPLRKINCHLLNNGATKTSVNSLMQKVKNIPQERIAKLSLSQAVQVTRAIIEKNFKQKFSSQEEKTSQRIKVFVGPTGAGKTTTLAKLASISVFNKKKHVILVSLDAYRLGAHEQLKAYADILGMPFYPVNTPQELKKLLDKTPSQTEVFIDTSGLNPMNNVALRKLTAFFSEIKEMNMYLVLTALYQESHFKTVISQFDTMGYDSIILTKIDEISSFGHLLSFLDLPVKNIDYLTNGQEVPKDIMKFSPNFIAEKILQVD